MKIDRPALYYGIVGSFIAGLLVWFIQAKVKFKDPGISNIVRRSDGRM